MLHVRSALGQTPPAYPIDPGTYAQLRAAGELLRVQGDPYAPQTVELIKRNIEAQGFPGGSSVSGAAGRVSSLNPILSVVATARENPYVTIGGLVFIPILAYMLGRSSKR